MFDWAGVDGPAVDDGHYSRVPSDRSRCRRSVQGYGVQGYRDVVVA